MQRLNAAASLKGKAEIEAKIQIEMQGKKKEKIEKLRLQLLDLKRQLPVYHLLSYFFSLFDINKVLIESDIGNLI